MRGSVLEEGSTGPWAGANMDWKRDMGYGMLSKGVGADKRDEN